MRRAGEWVSGGQTTVGVTIWSGKTKPLLDGRVGGEGVFAGLSGAEGGGGGGMKRVDCQDVLSFVV